MKKWAIASAALLLSTSVNASLINYDNLMTDTVTGLDWLSLSVTSGQSYSGALDNNPGWRYAGNLEVENLFVSVFDNYIDTNTRNHTAKNYDSASTLAEQAGRFGSLMGYTDDLSAYDTSYGLYIDETGVLRLMGVGTRLAGYATEVYSTEYTANYNSKIDVGMDLRGIFLVRNSIEGVTANLALSSMSPVPVPAAAWLFGSGLVGLIGVSRRKKK